MTGPLAVSPRPIGVIPGHSYLSPFGARAAGVLPEYFWNRRTATAFAVEALRAGWEGWAMVDEAGAPRDFGIIGKQHSELARLRCLAALELHYNSSSDQTVNYCSMFYKRGDRMSGRLAGMLHEALNGWIGGGSRSIVVALPDPPWTALASVLRSPVPLVLLEPGFLTSPRFVAWLGDNLAELGARLARVSAAFQSEVLHES